MIVPAASLAKTLNGFQRPFRTPLYPWLPIFALSAVGAVLATTAWLNIWLAITFIGLLALSVLYARIAHARMAVGLSCEADGRAANANSTGELFLAVCRDKCTVERINLFEHRTMEG
jgi:hypothetical protein